MRNTHHFLWTRTEIRQRRESPSRWFPARSRWLDVWWPRYTKCAQISATQNNTHLWKHQTTVYTCLHLHIINDFSSDMLSQNYHFPQICSHLRAILKFKTLTFHGVSHKKKLILLLIKEVECSPNNSTVMPNVYIIFIFLFKLNIWSKDQNNIISV